MFSVVLSSQFFCEKFFVRSVFLVVLSSQFPVPSIFALGTLGTRNKKIRFILKNTFYKKRLKKKVPSPEGSEEVKEITIGEKGSESRGSRGCSGIQILRVTRCKKKRLEKKVPSPEGPEDFYARNPRDSELKNTVVKNFKKYF